MLAAVLSAARILALTDADSSSSVLQPGLSPQAPPSGPRLAVDNETNTGINCTSTLSSVSDEDCVNQCGSPSLFFKSCPTDICECYDAEGNPYP